MLKGWGLPLGLSSGRLASFPMWIGGQGIQGKWASNTKDRYFKGRYSHQQGGKLELVEVIGRKDGDVVATINGLDAAMKLDLKARIDQFIQKE